MSALRIIFGTLLSLSVFLSGSPLPALADGCLPGDECYEKPAPVAAPARKSPVTAQPEATRQQTAPAPLAEEPCGWGNRFSAGVPVWMFDEEASDAGGGVYFDLYHCCLPLNLRVGAEVTHMDANQESALSAAEWNDGRDANLTFVRIPFAIEYVYSFNDSTRVFLGGGPDIIHTANDITETSVGAHLSARFMRDLTERFGIAVEAGYAWARVDTEEAGDVVLDNAFIVPSLVYTF